MDSNRAQLTIINKALFKIGAQRITSISDGSPNAVLVGEIYQECLTEVIEEAPWSFCLKNAVLNQIDLAEDLPNMADGVDIAYALPADYLDIYMINYPTAQIRQQYLDTPYVTSPLLALLSDTPGLIMRYKFINTNPTTYTSKFAEALSCKIAAQLCFKISEAAQYATVIRAEYKEALLSAISADSKTSTPDAAMANEWFIARLAGSGVVSGLPNGNIGFFPDPFNPDF